MNQMMRSFIGKQKTVSLKCTDCKTPYTEEISSDENSCEAECPECGTYNYGKYKAKTIQKVPPKTKLSAPKRSQSKEKAPSEKTAKFKKGDKVVIEYIFHGSVKESAKGKVHSTKKDLVYLLDEGSGDAESGVYYNQAGQEVDAAFYPQIYSRIKKA